LHQTTTVTKQAKFVDHHCFNRNLKSITMSNPQDVAQAFVNHFYQSFAANVDSLGGLYVSDREGIRYSTGTATTEANGSVICSACVSCAILISHIISFFSILLQNESSMLTFEGEQFQGSQSIITKLKGVGKVSHQVKSMDVQPSVGGNALVIFVTGHVSIGEGGNPLHFCEMFQLVSTGPNAYYVHNDVFRLNYGL
jgi:hypothetical protein